MQDKTLYFCRLPSLNLLFQKCLSFVQISKYLLLRPPQELIPDPEAAVVIHMLYGNQGFLPTDISHQFAVMGMQHVLVASGSNVNVVLQVAQLFTRHFGPFQRLALSTSLLTIWWYVLLTHTEAPVVRAAIMASLYLVSRWCHRAYHAGYALMVTVCIMLLWHPAYVRFLSFQLSVLATTGIVFVLPCLHKPGFYAALETSQPIVSGDRYVSVPSKIKATLSEAFYVTMAVQLTVTPWLMYVVKQFNVFALITNTVLIWLVPVIMTLVVVFTGVFYLAKIWFPLEYFALPLFGSMLWLVMHGLLTITAGSDVGRPLLFTLSLPLWGVYLWWSILLWWLIRSRKQKVIYEDWSS